MPVTSAVIIGAGQAGIQTAVALRTVGYKSPVVLIGDEEELPYQRPPLSKAFLKRQIGKEALTLRPQEFLEKNGIEYRRGESAISIDRVARAVGLRSGERVPYEHLVLATGSINRQLDIPGVNLRGVHYLRSVQDAEYLAAALEEASNIVVIGAGFVGLEVAASAAELGKKVTVIEAASRPLARSVSPACSKYFLEIHKANGVTVITNETVFAVEQHLGKVTGVATKHSGELPADLVFIGVGAIPNTSLAEAAAIEVSGGILVDKQLTASDPQISAIGDCAAFPYHPGGELIRLESVQNASDQAKFVAKKILGGGGDYVSLPWFWSDQYSTKLQIAGFGAHAERDVIRGNPESGSFSVFRFRGEQVLAVESLNAPRDHMTARKILSLRVSVTPEQVEDETLDLASLIRKENVNVASR